MTYLILVLMVVTSFIGMAAGEGRAETLRHSGTVAALDSTAGFVVVAETGPWRVTRGETEIVRHRVTVTPNTMFVRARRAEGRAPTGWIGDFIEETIEASTVRVGDHVTVLCQHDGKFLTALEVVVTAINEEGR